jgi:hypothetical protein
MQPGSRASLLRFGRKTSTGQRRAEGKSAASGEYLVNGKASSQRERAPGEPFAGLQPGLPSQQAAIIWVSMAALMQDHML